jgi:hypothetical protein
MTEQLREQLEEATQELKAHMASWEYAFAYGAAANDHPRHAGVRTRTQELRNRVKDLQARLAEHDL